MTDQCQKDKMSGNAQVKVGQQWLTNVIKIIRVGAHKPMSTNSGWPVKKRKDELKRASQTPPTVTDQYQKDKKCQKRQDDWERTSQSPPTLIDQCQKDKTNGSALVKVHQQWLTNVKKTRRGRAHMSKSTNNDWPVEKDTTSGSAKVNVHQQWLTNVKKTRRGRAHMSKKWLTSGKRHDERERKS